MQGYDINFKMPIKHIYLIVDRSQNLVTLITLHEMILKSQDSQIGSHVAF